MKWIGTYNIIAGEETQEGMHTLICDAGLI